MSEILQTKDLTLSYGERMIIDELNIEIPQGEISVFIGGNGCGKSTLLRSIARLLKTKARIGPSWMGSQSHVYQRRKSLVKWPFFLNPQQLPKA